MKKLLLFCLALVFALQSCYRDKGNYEYTEIPELTVKLFKVSLNGEVGTVPVEENERLYAYLAQPFRMKATVSFESEELAHENLTYTWSLDNKILSHEKDLDVVIPFDTEWFDYFGDLTVLDNETGISYVKKMRVSLSSNFMTGWMWLTKNGESTELNMFTNQLQLFTDMFEKINGYKLDPDTDNLVEHFQLRSSNFSLGQVLAVASGAGTNGAIELDHSTLRKRSFLKNEFMGGELPTGARIANVAYIDNYTAMVSESGRLYVRYSQGGFFQQGLFNNVPVYGDYELSPQMAEAKQTNSNTIVFYDKKSKSYRYLNKGALSDFSGVIDNGTAFDVTKIPNEPIYMKAVDVVTGKGSLFLSIVKDGSGKRNFQLFEVGVEGETHLRTVEEFAFGYDHLVNDHSIFDATWKSNNVLFSTNDKLYLFDKKSKGEPVLVKDFNGRAITTLSSGMAMNSWNSYKNDIGVTIHNGDGSYDFCVISVAGTTMGEIKNEFKGLKGEPFRMIFKIGTYNGVDN